ncbi:class I SAM-dependent methyltransferase [Planosporangium sp. 12N6]|uniref:class I SAM-dependent methyltransferase n=1 Tax=Planosporangium spinosum TaxID=3402278 RepID=UPI003CF22F6D
MTRIAYDSRAATAFEANRHLDEEGLAAWRAAVTRHLDPRPGTRLLDLGAGTGMWARMFTRWYDAVEIIAVEPSDAMRARCQCPRVLPGDAADIPLADDSVDAAWLSTVVHHVPDLTAAARELRRVLRPGGTVLIRSAFAGRHRGITLFRYFPEAVRVLDTYPSVRDVEVAFATAGFGTIAFEPVPQVTAPSLRAAVAALRRAAHTPLQLITDDEYAAGLARMRRAAETGAGTEPVIDTLDLLALR